MDMQVSFPVRDLDQHDRRASARTTSIYRPVIIEVGDFAGFCLVRNVSPMGMLGTVYAEFAANQPISIDFSPQHHVEGAIVWSRNDQIGVQFAHEIDVLEILRQLGKGTVDPKTSRAPRLQIQCPVQLSTDEGVIVTDLLDVSQRGLKVGVSTLKAGAEVTVRLPEFPPQTAIVRWVNSGVAGLNFIRPLDFGKLAAWAIHIQSG